MRRSFGMIRAGVGLSLAWAALAVLAVGVGDAMGQSTRLSTQLLQSPAVTAEQQDAIDAYIGVYIKQFIAAESPEKVAEARDKMLEPLRNPLSSEAVKASIRATAADGLVGAAGNDSLIVRLNALIVAADLKSGKAAPLIIPALTDKSPALRYWAAKAVAEINAGADPQNPLIADADQAKVLAALQKAAPAEKSDVVLEQQFRALAALTVAGGQDALMSILEQRVAAHAVAVNDGLRADQKALDDLYQKLVYAQAAAGANIQQPVKDLTTIAAQYLLVVAKALAGKKLDATLEPVAKTTAESAAKIFALALSQFDNDWPLDRRPPLSGPTLAPDVLLLNTLDWVGTPQKPGILTASKIAIPFEDLQPPAPATAPATAPKAPADPPATPAAAGDTDPK